MRHIKALALLLYCLAFVVLWTFLDAKTVTVSKSVTTGKCVWVNQGGRCDQLPTLYRVRPVP